MKKCLCVPSFLLFLFFSLSAQPTQVYINEILASNKSTNMSPLQTFEDWIEIANFSSESIDLSGCYLTDNFTEPTKWMIPANTILPGNSYLLFWADDRDSALHTNFKISKDGERIGLYTPSGIVIDTITFGTQYDDISFGRISDNITEWTFFSPPSPLFINQSSSEIDISPVPLFSLPGGFYTGNQIVALSSSDSSTSIRYTLDGTIPDTASALYELPLLLDSTIAIRARSFQAGKVPSTVITNTYFIDEDIHLPFISLVTDPKNFFNDEIGIYITGTNGIRGECDATIRNLNQDWERPINIEFYETTGEQRLNQGAGVKIFGGCSRTRYPQKSLALYARSEYGKGSFDYPLFPSKPITIFETFLLRSAGDDQVFTMLRDGLAHTTLSLGMNGDIQAYRPAVVFLNGAYWGIHNIREKVNEHYTEENFQVDPADVNILERNPYYSGNIKNGSAVSYNAMMDFLQSHDMSDSANYAYIRTQMDIDQFTDYQIGHIYLAEKDWPGNNIRFWKSNTGTYTRWRWINYDMDQTFTHITTDNMAVSTDPSGPSWPNPPWSTLLFRKLLENNSFRNNFIQRYAYYLSTIFKTENLIRLVDSLKDKIAPEIPRHINRWGGQLDPDFNEGWNIKPTFSSVDMWERNIDTIKLFCEQRPQYAVQHLLNKFGISGTATLTLSENIAAAGKIKMNGILLPDSGYHALYFKEIPLTIEAQPVLGYRFLYWTLGLSSVFSQQISLTLSHDTLLTAYYEPVNIIDSALVIINEINYNSSNTFNSGDWIELYNKQDQVLDLSLWTLKDEDDDNYFMFPPGTSLPARGYLVVSNALSDFHTVFPSVDTVIGSFRFGFKSSGEVIRLFSNTLQLIDSVHYDNEFPWPSEPDGSGASLELTDPSLDNDIPENWHASLSHGTPGEMNSTLTGIENTEKLSRPDQYELSQNYPNPFNPSTTIHYLIKETGFVRLDVFNVLGQLVCTLVQKELSPGQYRILWAGTNDHGHAVSSGMYILTLSAGSTRISQRMLLLK